MAENTLVNKHTPYSHVIARFPSSRIFGSNPEAVYPAATLHYGSLPEGAIVYEGADLSRFFPYCEARTDINVVAAGTGAVLISRMALNAESGTISREVVDLHENVREEIK